MKVVLSIDIGGTNTELAYIDSLGKICVRKTVETGDALLFSRYLEGLGRIKEEMEEEFPHYVPVAIGVGIPNVNHFTGIIESAANLNWEFPVNVTGECADFFELPVFVTNDANACAYGEMYYGAARGISDFIQVTLGTGFGSGIVVDTKIVAGSSGFGGEIGHSTLVKNGRECGCGRRGCVETYVSASGICRTVLELLCLRKKDSSLRSIAPADLTAQDIYEAACADDAIACEAFEKTAEWLAVTMADAVCYVSPRRVVFFGGLTRAGDLLMAPFLRYFKEYCMDVYVQGVDFTFSELPRGDAALLGAAAGAWLSLRK
jgi:glucokinase